MISLKIGLAGVFSFHFSGKLKHTRMQPGAKVDINIKILLIGDSNVGKSWYTMYFWLSCSILMRFIENKFNELSPTIGNRCTPIGDV